MLKNSIEQSQNINNDLFEVMRRESQTRNKQVLFKTEENLEKLKDIANHSFLKHKAPSLKIEEGKIGAPRRY